MPTQLSGSNICETTAVRIEGEDDEEEDDCTRPVSLKHTLPPTTDEEDEDEDEEVEEEEEEEVGRDGLVV